MNTTQTTNMSTLPARAARIQVDSAIDGRRIVHDPAARQYFRIGLNEAALLEALDGASSVEQLEHRFAALFSPEQIRRLLDWFHANGLLVSSPAPVPAATGWVKRAWRIATSSEKLQVHLCNPDAFLDRHIGIVRMLFSRPALACYILLFLAPVFLVAWNPALLSGAMASYAGGLSVAQGVGLYCMLAIMIFLHEMGHAAACKFYGGKVEKIGVMFMYLLPAAFCDVSDSWRFRDRNHKLIVTGAGLFVQLILGSLVFSAWLATGEPLLMHFALVNVATALFNFYPLIKLDGYWMLVHLLDEPNLQSKGLAALDAKFRSILPGRGQAGADLPYLWFGVGTAISIVGFSLLGLFSIHRILGLVAPELATVAVAIVGGFLLYRTVKAAYTYLLSLRLAWSAN